MMKRLVSFGLAVLVHVLLIGAFGRSLVPLPDGEVLITDLSNGGRAHIASRAESGLLADSRDSGEFAR